MKLKITKKTLVLRKKDMKNKDVIRKNMKITKKVFHSMKVIYEKAIKVNNDIKLNVDERQDDIKHLKEQYDIDDEDKVKEITAP